MRTLPAIDSDAGSMLCMESRGLRLLDRVVANDDRGLDGSDLIRSQPGALGVLADGLLVDGLVDTCLLYTSDAADE